MAKRSANKPIQPAPVAQILAPHPEYNEAVRLQAAVRDWVGYPVTLIQALQIARETFREFQIGVPGENEPFDVYVTSATKRKQQLERAASDLEAERLKRQHEIARNAGK
jgi:hypothetical protein